MESVLTILATAPTPCQQASAIRNGFRINPDPHLKPVSRFSNLDSGLSATVLLLSNCFPNQNSRHFKRVIERSLDYFVLRYYFDASFKGISHPNSRVVVMSRLEKNVFRYAAIAVLFATGVGLGQQQNTVPAKQPLGKQGTALHALQQYILRRYGSPTEVIQGRRFKVNQTVAYDFMQDVLNNIPKQEYADLFPMYKAIEGLDGSTTSAALMKCRSSFVGKYYVLQGDVFRIVADRDYPRAGLNRFSLFGNVQLVEGHYIGVNVHAISEERVPPYGMAPLLTQIIGFDLGKNRLGKTIIIPLVRVIMVISSASCCGLSDEVIASRPGDIADLLHLH